MTGFSLVSNVHHLQLDSSHLLLHPANEEARSVGGRELKLLTLEDHLKKGRDFKTYNPKVARGKQTFVSESGKSGRLIVRSSVMRALPKVVTTIECLNESLRLLSIMNSPQIPLFFFYTWKVVLSYIRSHFIRRERRALDVFRGGSSAAVVKSERCGPLSAARPMRRRRRGDGISVATATWNMWFFIKMECL